MSHRYLGKAGRLAARGEQEGLGKRVADLGTRAAAEVEWVAQRAGSLDQDRAVAGGGRRGTVPNEHRGGRRDVRRGLNPQRLGGGVTGDRPARGVERQVDHAEATTVRKHVSRRRLNTPAT